MERHIPSLDGIRACSILIVLIAHTGFEHLIPASFGVTVFFFLSGYLITSLLTQEYKQNGSIDIVLFLARRILRLGPPLIATLFLAYFLLFSGLTSGEFNGGALASQLLYYHNYFLLHIAETSSVDGLSVLWSLAVEEHFYLVYPFVLVYFLLPHKNKGVLCLSALILFLTLWRAFRYYALDTTSWEIYISSDTRIDSILYGCLLAIMNHTGLTRKVLPSTTLRSYAVLFFACVLLAFSALFRNPDFRDTIKLSLQGMALIPIFYYATQSNRLMIFAPLNNGFVKKIGLYSYSIYLVHYVIYNSALHLGIQKNQVAILTILTMILSYLYAALVYHFAEKPLTKYKHKLQSMRKPVK